MSCLCCCLCCKLRGLVLAIALVFLVVQTGFLAATFAVMPDIDGLVSTVLDWFAAEAEGVEDVPAKEGFQDLRVTLVKRASDFIAIPITINIVLMISNGLLAWACVAKHKILIWPWLILHTLEWFGFLALLIYLMIVMPQPYLKVILFLVVSPVLVIAAFCIFAVKCFYNYLRDLSLKDALNAVYNHQQNHIMHKHEILPATMYSTTDSQWDHPLPIWTSGGSSSGHKAEPWDPIMHQQQQQQQQPRQSSSSNNSVVWRRGGGLTPTMLPDGTLVVPLADKDAGVDDLTEIEEEDDDEDYEPRRDSRKGVVLVVAPPTSSSSSSGGGGGYQKSKGHSSVVSSSGHTTSLSDRYRAQPRSSPMNQSSDDGRRSVMSLSEKYRQQEEVEVFEDVYRTDVPGGPKKGSSVLESPKGWSSSSAGSSSNKSVSAGGKLKR